MSENISLIIAQSVRDRCNYGRNYCNAGMSVLSESLFDKQIARDLSILEYYYSLLDWFGESIEEALKSNGEHESLSISSIFEQFEEIQTKHKVDPLVEFEYFTPVFAYLISCMETERIPAKDVLRTLLHGEYIH